MNSKSKKKKWQYYWCTLPKDNKAVSPGAFVREVIQRKSSLFGENVCIFGNVAKGMRAKMNLEHLELHHEGITFIRTNLSDGNVAHIFDMFWEYTYGELMGAIVSPIQWPISQLKTMSEKLEPIGCIHGLLGGVRKAGLWRASFAQTMAVIDIASVAVFKEYDGDCICFVPGQTGTNVGFALEKVLKETNRPIHEDSVLH